MLVYCTHAMTAQEPTWIQPLATMLAERGHATWRPNGRLQDLLGAPHVLAHLDRQPPDRWVRAGPAFGLDPVMFLPFSQDTVTGMMARWDHPDPKIVQHQRDLYALIRADVVIADLSDPAPEVGVDLLFARSGGSKIVGLTDRFLHAPSVLARLDVMMVPTDVGGIVDVVQAFTRERPAGQVSVLDRVNAVIEQAERTEREDKAASNPVSRA